MRLLANDPVKYTTVGKLLAAQNIEHLREPFVDGVGLCPARQLLRHMVKKLHPPLYISCHNSIADTAQRGHQPLLAFLEPLFHLVLVKGHLDAGIELAFFKGFENVTERLGDLRAV